MYPKLTQQQRELLHWLVEKANVDVGKSFSFRVEQVYHDTWNLFLPTGGGRDRINIADLLQLREVRYVSLQKTERNKMQPFAAQFVHQGQEEPALPPSPQPSKQAGYQGALTQQAFEYYKWAHMGRLERDTRTAIAALKGDVRTVVFSIITALLTTIIIAVLSKWLGLSL
jgi:hypothetical protein